MVYLFLTRKFTGFKTITRTSKNFTLAGWTFGLGKLGQSSSLMRLGRVGVKGWKVLAVGVNADPGGSDSNSLWRLLILCRSSFKYSIASPRIEALSIW
jgi:hypothetical protein